MTNSPPNQQVLGKKKGPIRVGVVGPVGLIIAGMALYFVLLFDFHLRKTLEFAGTFVNGAEVNIGYLDTSFVKASFEMGEIQVTHPETPSKNRVHIGAVRFKLLWDALLRAKFVIDLASVTDIRANTQRESPGRVLEDEGTASAGSVTAGVFQKAKEQFAGTGLSNIGEILEGFDPSKNFKGIEGNLKSTQRLRELEKELDTREKEWSQSLTSIPGQKDFDNLQTRITNFKAGGTRDPNQIRKQVNEINKIVSETKGKTSEVTNKGNKITRDMSQFQRSLAELKRLEAEDRRSLESKLKIPAIDEKSLSEQLFGPAMLSRVQEFEKYKALAQKHMPPPTAADGEAKVTPPARKRWEGKNYFFPRRGSYPQFWMKKAEISSTFDGSNPYSGNIAGEVVDVTSDQKQLGRPTVAKLNGDFPGQGVKGIKFRAVLDHRKETPVDTFTGSVASFPVADKHITRSEGLTLGLRKASGSGDVEAVMKGDRLSIQAESRFSQADYDVKAKSAALQSIFSRSLNSLPFLSINAKASGTWSDINWSISSNLGKALQSGFASEVQAKLAGPRKKIKEMLDVKNGAKKKQLTSRFTSKQKQITSAIDGRKQQAQQIVAMANNKIKQAQSPPPAAKKAVRNIKKKFGF